MVSSGAQLRDVRGYRLPAGTGKSSRKDVVGEAAAHGCETGSDGIDPSGLPLSATASLQHYGIQTKTFSRTNRPPYKHRNLLFGLAERLGGKLSAMSASARTSDGASWSVDSALACLSA